jgi:flagellar basal-body rod protein FlgC
VVNPDFGCWETLTMPVARLGSPIDIAISGLRAETLRMKVISGNIANSRTSRTDTGAPYRRQDVALSTSPGAAGGVQIGGIVQDMSTDFQDVYMPGHPDADKNGMVKMPNVDLPTEMMSMVGASRAYQANAAILKRYQDMVNATLELLR